MVSVIYSFFFPFFPVIAFAYLIHKRFVAFPIFGLFPKILSACMAVGYAGAAWGFISHSIVLPWWVTAICSGAIFIQGFFFLFAGRFLHEYAENAKKSQKNSAVTWYYWMLIFALIAHVVFGVFSLIWSTGLDGCANLESLTNTTIDDDCCTSDCFSNTPHPGLLVLYFAGLGLWTVSYLAFFVFMMYKWSKYDRDTGEHKDD